MTLHTKYSPSAAHRWLNCAASLLPAREPAEVKPASFYAEEGTAAHALLELCLRLDHAPDKFLGHLVHKEHAVTQEMADAVAHALDWIKSYQAKRQNRRAELHFEYTVPMQDLLRAPNYEQGTADVILDNAPHELVVMDYKHGAGVEVEVEDNEQLMLYAAGYAHSVRKEYERYRIIVVQPRVRHRDGPVREHVLSAAVLAAFVRRVRARVKHNEARPDDAKAGTWCKWCTHAPDCRALAEHVLQAAQMEFADIDVPAAAPPDVQRLSNEELAGVLTKASLIESWLKDVRGAALRVLMAGGKVPGYKLVRGRTMRSFDNADQVQAQLARAGFEIDEYAPRTLLSVAGVEALFKQRKRGASLPQRILAHVVASTPAIHVAPEHDRRVAYTRGEEFHEAD